MSHRMISSKPPLTSVPLASIHERRVVESRRSSWRTETVPLSVSSSSTVETVNDSAKTGRGGSAAGEAMRSSVGPSVAST